MGHELKAIEENEIDDDIEVTCLYCGEYFYIPRWMYLEDLMYESVPEYTCDSCDPDTYVIIRDESAGNDSIGEMWKETKIFGGDSTLDDVMAWAMKSELDRDKYPSRKNIITTKPHC